MAGRDNDITEGMNAAWARGFKDGQSHSLLGVRVLIAALIAESDDDNATVSTLTNLLERMPR